ncbi:MAG: M6 family metalloprotease domain-containing protein [Bacteroidales bacterium]|jgi:M6 family metalloprotease-like protein|nr:M6 family metalloprotease domain-containing protein [Bacteroidales bacterium]
MKKSFFLFSFIFLSFRILLAVPAYPYPFTFTQPNGETLTVYIKGDHRIHWYESMDEFTLLINSDGYMSYAQLDESGNLQSSAFIATDIEKRNIIIQAFLSTISKKLFYSSEQQQVMLKIWQIEDEATAFNKSGKGGVAFGQIKTLLCFVQFPEKSMIKSMDQFDGLLNQLGYTGNGTGSVRDYFRESSYEQMDITITMCGIYTAPKSSAYYATEGAQELAWWLAMELVKDSTIDFRDYDADGDKMVDGFHFIFAGIGQEAGGGQGCIWSHMSMINPVYKNGKFIRNYSCSPELLSGGITTIGVICHEMSHAMINIPDFYDTGGNGFQGTGNWDIMASGSWNGIPGGNCPPHHNMATKAHVGWVEPILLEDPETILNMPNSAKNPIAYKINTNTLNEYFLLDNRQKIGFDLSVPGEGLLIYRVRNCVTQGLNSSHPQGTYPVCASSNLELPNGNPASYGLINSAGCPFPGTTNQTSFTDDTTPSMKSWNGNPNKKPITDITHNNRLISFVFMGGSCLMAKNLNVEYEANCSKALINWDNSSKGNQYDLLWNNLAGMDNKGYKSVRWTGASYSDRIVMADDFEVPEDEIWFIREVTFHGYPGYDTFIPKFIGVAFYHDTGNSTPQTTAFYEKADLIPDGGIVTGEMTVMLPKPIIINKPGKYWVSIYGVFESPATAFNQYYIKASTIENKATMCRWDPLKYESDIYSPNWKPNQDVNFPSMAFELSGYKSTDSITRYILYRDGKRIAGPMAETTFEDVDFDISAEHTWSVTAICSHTGEGKSVSIYKEPCYVGINEINDAQTKIYSYLNSIYVQYEVINCVISIFDMMGRVVYHGTSTNSNTVIPLNVTNGIYGVRVITPDDNIIFRKVLLTK